MSGAQIGQKKLMQFEAWVGAIEQAGSQEYWKGKFAGSASREKIAIEGLGWKNKTPFHQNKPLRDAIDRVEKKWFGGPDKQGIDSPSPSPKSSPKEGRQTSFDRSRTASKLSELEAEVRVLRTQVRAYEEQRDLIARGVPGFELP